MLNIFHFKTAFTALSIVSAIASFAQNEPDWSISSGDNNQYGTMMALDSQGNIIVTGYRPSFIIDAHSYTYKYNTSGELIWDAESPVDVANNYERASWINVDSQDNIYITGYRYTGTSTDFTNAIFVIKYASNGVQQWKKIIDHTLLSALPLRADFDSNENLIIGTIAVDLGFEMIKLNGDGDIIAEGSNNTSSNYSFSSMRVKDNLVVMVSPAFNGTKAAIAAFNTDGTFLWSQLVDSNGAADVEITDENQIFLLSRKSNIVSKTSNFDFHIIEFDTEGNQVNTYAFDFNNTNDFPSRLVYNNGRLSIIGSVIEENEAYMDWITFQINTEGEIMWSAKYDAMLSNDEKPRWISALPNGDVYVSGQGGPVYNSPIGTQFMQYVALRYSNGNIVWQDTDIYQGYIGIHSVVNDNCELYVLGETAQTINHYHDECDTPNAIWENEIQRNASILLYPNPASSSIQITLPNHPAGIVEIRLYNSFGELVHVLSNATTIEGAPMALTLPQLPKGMYMISAGLHSGKLIIE